MNDAAQFHELPLIGPGLACDFPPDAYLLADKMYPNQYPLMSPFNVNQFGNNGPDRDAKIIFNTEFARCRVFIEHAISYFKTDLPSIERTLQTSAMANASCW